MTDDEIRSLPVLLTVPEAGRVLGVGRTLAYQLVRRGEWPTAVIRVGSQIRIPKNPLLELMGFSPTSPTTPPAHLSRSTIKAAVKTRRDVNERHDVQEMFLPGL